MGKRSRKRMADGEVAAAGTSRAQRDEARRQRADAASAKGSSTRRSYARGRPSVDDRPEAPWGKFPLSELTVLVSIVLILGSFAVQGTTGGVMFIAGLLLGALAGLEVSIREHFAGYRSHSSLLAGALAILSITVVALAAGKVFVPILLGIGIAVFAASFVLFREAFRRRSGGVSFR
jgi:hypothetical protein